MGFSSLYGRDFGDGDFQKRFEPGIAHGNKFVTDKKLCAKGRRVSQLEAAAVDDYQSVQFASLVTGNDIWPGGRQKNGADEHGQTNDGRNETAAETEREKHQGGSGDSQENPEEHPRARVATQVHDSWHDQNESKEPSDRSVAQPSTGYLRLRLRAGSRAHGWSIIQGCKLLISRMRAKARRTWGMVMEPPTINATLSASITSSRFQPSSPQRTRC